MIPLFKFSKKTQLLYLKQMKETILKLLVCCLLLTSTYMMGFQRHKEVIGARRQSHKQDPSSAAAAAAAGKATEILLEQLIKNPAQAAKIPTKLIQGRIDGLIQLFEGSWNIKKRSRSLQLTFNNLSTRKVIYHSDYFDSGTWYKTWLPEISSFGVVQGLVSNRQGSWFCGVTGGIKLEIEDTGIYIYLGFNNPYIGGYKNFGELSYTNRGPKYGYDKSSNNSPKVLKLNKYKLQIVQTESDIAQMAIVYQLSNS